MALELSTAGMKVKYCIESTKGVRPTTAYTVIPGVKSIPEFGTEKNTIQSTPLSATKNHTYVPGLADSGGAIQLTVNDYPAFRTAWTTLMSAYASAVSSQMGLWVEYAYPEGSGMDSFYYPAMPTDLGFGGAEVDAVIENAASFIPMGDYVFASASTSSIE